MHEFFINHPPFVVHSYGAMLAVAFLLGIALTSYEARKAGLSPDDVLDMSIYVIIFSILMSRAVYVMTGWHEFAGHAVDALKIWDGGLSFHGGVIGGSTAGVLFCVRRKISSKKMIDAVMPGLAVGLAIGRIGCFLNGCCFGCATHLPWAVHFPVRPGGPAPFDGIPRHPTQIYDSLMNIAIMLLLVFPLKKLKRKDGDLLAFWLILDGVSRYIMEIFRSGQSSVVTSSGFTLAQWVCFGMIAAGIIIYFIKGKAAPVPAAAPATEKTKSTASKVSSKKHGGKKNKGK